MATFSTRRSSTSATVPDKDAENRRRAEVLAIVEASIATMTPEEDAALTAAAEADPDNPPLTDELLAHRRSMPPEYGAALARRLRGRPRSNAPKRLVSLRLDPDVIERFRATGPGWQSRVNALLRQHMPKL